MGDVTGTRLGTRVTTEVGDITTAALGDDEILESVILKIPLQELDEKHPSYRVYTWQIPVVV